MLKLKIVMYMILVGLLCLTCTPKDTGSIKKTDVAKDTKTKLSKIDMLMSKMTLEEKIGQMNQYNGFWDATGPAPEGGDSRWKYDHLKSGLVGSVLNVTGAEAVRAMQKEAVEGSRLGIPLIFGLDVIHGHKTLTPVPLAETASWDLEAIELSARNAAIEASSRGINWTFAPMVDISRDARWGRVMEGAGEDTYLGCQIARARVKGFQGKDLKANNTIAACAKHFAGYGFAEAGMDYNTVDVGTSTLYNVILPPFKACVDEGVLTVMNSFNILNGVPATGDKFLQREVLKDRWDFQGFVISDWGSGKEMIDHGFAKDLKDVAIIATNAGSDMDMESYGNIRHLKEAVEEGKVDVKYIDDACRRILQAKEDLGLFDDPYKYCNVKREKELLYNDKHMEDALNLAKKSIVLLKNENSILPLSKKEKDLAVIGVLAGEKNSPLGNWRMGSDDNSAISVLEGLKEIGLKHKYEKGPDLIKGNTSFIHEVKINETDRTGFKEAVKLAKKSKKVVLVMGEHGYQSGEGRSRAKLGLPGLQQELLEAIHEVNPNIVLVTMSGRPLVLTWADENIPAILHAWQLGTQSGHAIAAALVGDYNPSGKIPMTFPRSVGQVPIYYNHMSSGRPGPIDLVFWRHYTDEVNAPLYPFGHGLSYTDFEYSDVTVTNNFATTGKVDVSVQLKNTGSVKGKEVVQLYIRDLVASTVRPIKELKGFELVPLEAGESKTITFDLTKEELGFFDPQGKFIFEAGEFHVFIGGSSDLKEFKKFEIQ